MVITFCCESLLVSWYQGNVSLDLNAKVLQLNRVNTSCCELLLVFWYQGNALCTHHDIYTNSSELHFVVNQRTGDIKISCCYLSSTTAKQIVAMAAHGFVGTWEVNKPVKHRFSKPIPIHYCYVVRRGMLKMCVEIVVTLRITVYRCLAFS
jgi:hypothetical protein